MCKVNEGGGEEGVGVGGGGGVTWQQPDLAPLTPAPPPPPNF